MCTYNISRLKKEEKFNIRVDILLSELEREREIRKRVISYNKLKYRMIGKNQSLLFSKILSFVSHSRRRDLSSYLQGFAFHRAVIYSIYARIYVCTLNEIHVSYT